MVFFIACLIIRSQEMNPWLYLAATGFWLTSRIMDLNDRGRW